MRFAPKELLNTLVPVTFPPGLFRLETRPMPTALLAAVKTTGIVDVAALAASADGVPPAASNTETFN